MKPFLSLLILAATILVHSCTAHAQENLIPVKVGANWGYASLKGEVVIQPAFEKAFRFANGRAIVKVKPHTLYGYINEKGEFALPAIFHRPGSFESGVAMVVRDRTPYYEVIDTNGTVLFTEKTKGIKFCGYYENGIARACKLDNNGMPDTFYVDTKGDRVATPLQPDSINTTIDNRSVRGWRQKGIDSLYYFFYLPKNSASAWGVMDVHGKIILPAAYRRIFIFNKDLFLVMKKGESLSAPVNAAGEKIFPTSFDNINRNFSNGFYGVW